MRCCCSNSSVFIGLIASLKKLLSVVSSIGPVVLFSVLSSWQLLVFTTAVATVEDGAALNAFAVSIII